MSGPTADPDVSVLIAAWNAEATLARAIESALAQTGVSLEVIVVDDASTDGTKALAADFAGRHDHVRVDANPQNSGPAVARNRALDLARGRYVAVLDSDDFLDPGRFAKLVELADAHEADFLADDLWRVGETDVDGPRRRHWSQSDIGWQPLGLSAFIEGNLTTANGLRGELGFLKPLLRRRFLSDHELRYDPAMRLGEDYMLYAQALVCGAKAYLTDPAGYVAVARTGSLSDLHSTADLGALVSADHALAAQAALSPRQSRALAAHLTDTKKRWYWMKLIDAVKARDLGAAARCFADSPKVSAHLVVQLLDQVVIRSARRVGLRHD